MAAGAIGGGRSESRSILAAVPTVSFLFVDQVGSTEQLRRLGDSEAAPLRRSVHELLHSSVSDHGGRIVDNTGDGVMAVFDGAVDAVTAGAVMLHAAARLSAQATTPDQHVTLRVGVHTGDPVEGEDGRYFGMSVVVAARLCAVAPPGQLLVSDLVRALVAPRGAFEFEPAGDLVLKGVGDPVTCFTVRCDLVGRAHVAPLPPPIDVQEGFGFVGRQSELERLRAHWKSALAGNGTVALLAGEPGVGKTRLAREFARANAIDGATVLFGRCDDGIGVPYQPFVEALSDFITALTDDELGARLGPLAEELGRLAPQLRSRVAGLRLAATSDAASEEFRLFEAMAGWVCSLAREAPVVLVVDDAHWAQQPTLLMLRHLTRKIRTSRVLIVVTYRDTEVDRAHPLSKVIGDLRRDANVERVALGGLNQDEVSEFVEQAAGHALDERARELASAIHDETEGNPFFVSEVLRHLAESGAVFQRDGRWTFSGSVTDLGIPEGVRDVVGRRLDRLSPTTNEVLSIASVVGHDFALNVVEAAARPEVDVVAALDEAAAASVVSEVQPGPKLHYRFNHALIRSLLYDELSTARRVRLHGRVAEALEQAVGADDYAAAVAHHRVEAATIDNLAFAVVALVRAGNVALRQAAAADALSHARRGLVLLEETGCDDDSLRLPLLLLLATAEARVGDPSNRADALEAAALAAHLGDAASLAAAALIRMRSVATKVGQVDSERVAVLEQALDAVEPEDSSTRARLLALLGAELEYGTDPELADRFTSEALAMARRVGDRSVLVYTISLRLGVIQDGTDAEEVTLLVAELLDLVGDSRDLTATWFGLDKATNLALLTGDLAAAARYVARTREMAIETRDAALDMWSNAGEATLAQIRGDLDEVERLAQLVLETGQAAGDPDALLMYAAELAAVRFWQGRTSELVGMMRAVADGAGTVTSVTLGVALMLLESGDAEAARAIVADTLGEEGVGGLPRQSTWLASLAILADLCSDLGIDEHAQGLYDALLPYRHLYASVGIAWWGSVERNLGSLSLLLGRTDEAIDHLRSAVAAHEQAGALPWLSRSRVDLAGALARAGEHDAALRELDAAQEIAERLGLVAVSTRAALVRDAVPAGGGRVSPKLPPNPAVLP